MTTINQKYLCENQYRDASKLNARIELHRRYKTNPYDWFQWVFDHFNLPDGNSILEVGCGPASLWKANLERIPPSWVIVLSDFSPGMIGQAQNNLADVKANLRYEVFDAQTIPFDTGTFDLVIANHMLYHVPNRPSALNEIRRVLKRGGRLLAATNGAGHMKEINALTNQFDNRLLRGLSVTNFSAEFNLSNGRAQIGEYFERTAMDLFDDGLIITEAAPLAAYIMSMNVVLQDNEIQADTLGKLEAFLDDMLQKQGPIHITKSNGLFIGFKD